MVRKKSQWELTKEQELFLSAIIKKTEEWVVRKNIILNSKKEKKWKVNPRNNFPPEEGWLLPADLRKCLKTLLPATNIAKVRTELKDKELLETITREDAKNKIKRIDNKGRESFPTMTRLNIFEDGRDGFKELTIHIFEWPFLLVKIDEQDKKFQRLIDYIDVKYGHRSYYIQKFIETLGYNPKYSLSVFNAVMNLNPKPFIEFLKNDAQLPSISQKAIQSLNRAIADNLGEDLAPTFTVTSLAYAQNLTFWMSHTRDSMNKMFIDLDLSNKRSKKDQIKAGEAIAQAQLSLDAINAFNKGFEQLFNGLRKKHLDKFKEEIVMPFLKEIDETGKSIKTIEKRLKEVKANSEPLN